jgi:hypothetical protein
LAIGLTIRLTIRLAKRLTGRLAIGLTGRLTVGLAGSLGVSLTIIGRSGWLPRRLASIHGIGLRYGRW